MIRITVALALALCLTAGCPETSSGPVDAAECERIGQQCRLREGVVGVCNDTGDTGCESPPCLACMPQH